ncbi:MAG: mannose-1-phosphate guanylyltransferase, partial [Bacteroidales bacterium]|nr:mannose-1-phosphate guanylyltransferase [Bacteroidales bacterium]
MNKNYFCVIMAGGMGTRFWPASRIDAPKQFIDILGTGKTFLQMTVERFQKIIPIENIFIVTGKKYKDLTLQQIPGIKEDQVLLEPFGKNTAPCIAFANACIKRINPNATIIVSPSDHLILQEDNFLKEMENGLSFARDNEILLTMGIKPHRPNTGYGYIQVNAKKHGSNGFENIFKVKTFTEKPTLELAKQFVSSREFYWNSGMFIWNLKAIEKEFKKYLPEVYQLFENHLEDLNSDKIIYKIYETVKNISIDYGIMEKSKNVHVLCADFGWSDLGTWLSLYEIDEKDENGNSIRIA